MLLIVLIFSAMETVMLKRYMVRMLGLVFLTGCGLAMAESAAERVQVQDPYVRAVPPGQPNSASFMTLHNGDSRDHALVGAESPVARVVELHTHTMRDGMMQMRPVERIALPAGAATSLQPGGFHVMLIGLQKTLVPDQTVSLSLIFEDGSKAQVSAPVRKLQMHMHQQTDHGKHHGEGEHTPQEHMAH
jgi:copper(I)-binding protein